MNWKSGLALVAAIALLAGCGGPSNVGVGGTPRGVVYATVVSLSPSTTEYIAIGVSAGFYLGGKTSACDRPEQIANVPVVVSGTTPDYEKILAIEPDLIVYDASLYGPDEVARIKGLGIETLAYDPTDIKGYEDFGYRLGAKIGTESEVSKHIDRVYQEIAAAQATPSTLPRTTVLLGPEEGQFFVMGTEGFHSWILKTCGATPVGASGKHFQEAKIESLIEWDPEVIYSDGHAQEIYADPRLQSVSAVKNLHVYDYDAKTLVRVGGHLQGIIKQMTSDISKLPIAPREAAAQ